jgi:amidase
MPRGFPPGEPLDHRPTGNAAAAGHHGQTRTPELCLSPMTDTPDAVVRNSWAPAYVPPSAERESLAK